MSFVLPLAAFFLLAPIRGVPEPTTADGQPDPALQEMNFTLEGKITQQSAGKLSVSTEQNIVFHVSYDTNTDIEHDGGGKGSGDELRVGVRIKVDGDLTGSGEIKAHKIVIENPQKTSANTRHALRSCLSLLALLKTGSHLPVAAKTAARNPRS